MNRIRLRNSILITSWALFWLAACNSQPPFSGSTSAVQFSPTPAPTENQAYPSPGERYPPPGNPVQSTSPALQGGEHAYPGPAAPGSQVLPTAPPTPNPYLAPGEEQPASPENPYPGPQSGQPAAGQATPANPAPQPTAALRTELQSTDPQTVQLASGRLQLVEFYAAWCGDCRAMAPVIHDLQDRYAGRMNFVFLDIQDPQTQPFQDQLGFEYPPQIFLLDGDGRVLNEWVGYVSQAEISAHIATALG
jgi:thiol-disulfide isomerase/thioredoxin